MKITKALAINLSRALVALGLFSFVTSTFAATTTSIATISSASTDGTASSSTFQLSVTSGQLANALTTSSDIELSLALAPQASHRGLKASVYTVIVAGGKFFKLTEDGSYAPWNGTVEDLTPFTTNQTLESANRFTLLDGKMAEAGSYLYFVAYGVEGESRLLFTPDPAQIVVTESDVLPDDTTSVAAETFEAELESAVVQAKCILCHVEGGLARNSSLQFQRTNTASALNNFASLSAYVDEKGAELLLSKITGGDGHAGGMQLSQDSEGYEAFERVIAAINELDNPTYYAFSGSSEGPSARQASFLTEVTLEPRESTLRRATLLLQGRLPTEQESKAVTSDAALRVALRNLMQGPSFREFIVTGVNDRLLIEGSDTIVEDTMKNFAKLHAKRVEFFLDDDDSTDMLTLYHLTQGPASRAAGELVAHVVETEKPYSEILTADYMMVNSDLNELLEGTAVFGKNEAKTVFKPARLKGYYYPSSLKETVRRVNSNSSYEIIGPPLAVYPHTGILSDFGFLTRYPTTATNRNRARARWTFYHFLGIDIEKSSQRPTDEASLTDRNNPTMNNPNCTVCHMLLDPVAGAFQNWDDHNLYRSNGHDGLDPLYKWPDDGSQTPWRVGDLWYRDMRAPGLFSDQLVSGDRSLRELAELIVEEPGFLTATAKFWWPSVFGKEMLDKPAVQSDQGYAAKYAAYQAQQEALDQFAVSLGSSLNAKDMFVEMFMSPWFGAETTASYAFAPAQFEAQFGNRQLLTPEQLAKKTRATTGVSWRSSRRVDGGLYSSYDTFSVLLGGIDSESVTSRATELTPTMTAILMTHATESACPAVIRQFAKPKAERSLLNLVESSTLPLVYASESFDVPSIEKFDWKKVAIQANLSPGQKEVSVTFLNPYCDYDGMKCLEQRNLYVDSVTVTSPSGVVNTIAAADSRTELVGQHCYKESQGHASFYNACTLHLDLEFREAGTYKIESSVSAQLAPRKGGSARVSVSVSEDADILSANTPNSRAIRNQIKKLFSTLHGKEVESNSNEVDEVYELFAASLVAGTTAHDGTYYCDIHKDGLFDEDNFSKEELEQLRTVIPGQDWYEYDWSAKSLIENERFRIDTYRTKYAWTAVMMYMLSHYDYIHE